jgi:hypothetical protein
MQKRDLSQIGFKIKQVMLPSLREEGKKQLRNCTYKCDCRGLMGTVHDMLNAQSVSI